MNSMRVKGDLNIYEAVQMKREFMEQLHSSDGLEIDLADVGEMDSSGLQLLMLVKKEAHAAGKTVRFVGHSKAVVEVLELVNLIPAFGDPVLILKNEEI